jgi:hypothetical protein
MMCLRTGNLNIIYLKGRLELRVETDMVTIRTHFKDLGIKLPGLIPPALLFLSFMQLSRISHVVGDQDENASATATMSIKKVRDATYPMQSNTCS